MHRLDDEPPARPEDTPELAKRLRVPLLADVAECSEEVQHGVEAVVVERQPPVIRLDELELSVSCTPAGLVQEHLRAIGPGDLYPARARTSECRPNPQGQSGPPLPARLQPRARLRVLRPRFARTRAEAHTTRDRPRRRACRTQPCVHARESMKELADYRAEFPILEHTTYLINHSLGAMPAAAEDAPPRVRAHVEESAESAPGVRAGGRCR